MKQNGGCKGVCNKNKTEKGVEEWKKEIGEGKKGINKHK